jgi:hypothetical protein
LMNEDTQYLKAVTGFLFGYNTVICHTLVVSTVRTVALNSKFAVVRVLNSKCAYYSK